MVSLTRGFLANKPQRNCKSIAHKLHTNPVSGHKTFSPNNLRQMAKNYSEEVETGGCPSYGLALPEEEAAAPDGEDN
jgi:hypothetical protein